MRLASLALIALCLTSPALAQPAASTPAQHNSKRETDLIGHASVIDGDTIEIHGTLVRLWGQLLNFGYWPKLATGKIKNRPVFLLSAGTPQRGVLSNETRN